MVLACSPKRRGILGKTNLCQFSVLRQYHRNSIILTTKFLLKSLGCWSWAASFQYLENSLCCWIKTPSRSPLCTGWKRRVKTSSVVSFNSLVQFRKSLLLVPVLKRPIPNGVSCYPISLCMCPTTWHFDLARQPSAFTLQKTFCLVFLPAILVDRRGRDTTSNLVIVTIRLEGHMIILESVLKPWMRKNSIY